MPDSKLAALRQKHWKKNLPLLVAKDARASNPYDYYSVHLVDVDRNRYQLRNYQHRTATLARWDYDAKAWTDERRMTVAELDRMQAEIIHHRSYGQLPFSGILSFSFHRVTRLAYLKTLIGRGKGKLVSSLFASRELKSRDRIPLLNLLVNEYVQQRPSRLNAGVSIDETIDMLYGRLWYKHIRNEEFRRRVRLLLKSLTITGDLAQIDALYYVQPQSVATIVEFEKEERRARQRDKMQRNIVRLMIVITAATVLITLALLGLAGVIDLQQVWQFLRSLNPFGLLMKLA